ncbi:MAG: hypothetical protein AAB354_07835 [candidate division KSB1 bacterium]|mgnify:CR=1 FL=1
MLTRKFIPLALTFWFLSQLVFAQTSASTKPDTTKPAEQKSEKKKDWDVAATHGPTKETAFTTDEGTWMNLDVSPDGAEVVFDLLGDIYSMPLNGEN